MRCEPGLHFRPISGFGSLYVSTEGGDSAMLSQVVDFAAFLYFGKLVVMRHTRLLCLPRIVPGILLYYAGLEVALVYDAHPASVHNEIVCRDNTTM